MKFRSPTDEPVHIALTSGHTCVIGPKPIEVDALFHREAIARGCEPDGIKGKVPKALKPEDRKDLIVKAINEMLEGNVEGDFGKDSKPDTQALSKRVGFGVERDERDAIWSEIEKATKPTQS